MAKATGRSISVVFLAAVIIAGLLLGGTVAYAAPVESPGFSTAQIAGVNVVARETPLVLQGEPNQKAGGITIAESTQGTLPRDDIWLRVVSPAGVSFANTPLALRTSGNISVGTATMANGLIRVPVSAAGGQPELANIGITNIRYNVSPTAPTVNVMVQVVSSETTPTTTTPGTTLGTVTNATVAESVSTGFPDVGGRFFAAPAINLLVAEDIVDGYPDGTFRPQTNVTRAEFVKMVIEARETTPIDPTTPPFSDVPVDHWAAGYIAVARNIGFVTGYPDGTFRPDQPISRAEIAAVIVRAGGFVTLTGGTTFPDVPTTYWAFEEIMTARNHGIIQGFPNGTFMPDANATRAESAVMIFNWLTDR